MEVYVTVKHNFHQLRKQGKFAPSKILYDPAIVIRPIHSYLSKKITFKIAIVTEVKKYQLPSHCECPFKVQTPQT